MHARPAQQGLSVSLQVSPLIAHTPTSALALSCAPVSVTMTVSATMASCAALSGIEIASVAEASSITVASGAETPSARASGVEASGAGAGVLQAKAKSALESAAYRRMFMAEIMDRLRAKRSARTIRGTFAP